MLWYQKTLRLQSRSRGFHLITSEVTHQLPELRKIRTGLCHLFLMHTSAALTLNENADPDVRADMRYFFDKQVAMDPGFTHVLEGEDDITAHIKTSLIGPSLTIPVHEGNLHLGTWQGIYLCEFRNHGGARRLAVTLMGEERQT